MASFKFEMPDDFQKQLAKLSNIDEIAPKMIDEAIPILESNLKKEVSKHMRSGDMAKSIKKTMAKPVKNGGFFAIVRPTGVDNKGIRNMEKLVYLENGTKKQAATPVITKAINDSKDSVSEKMQEVFNREIEK